MNNAVRRPVYTEISDCRDCYRCVRTCPVKAIQIKGSHAEIIDERCTYCGICVHECPNGVKKIRNDVDRVRMLLSENRRVIVSLAPSYVSEFQGNEDNYIRALYELGFDAVSETAVGAALVSQALDLYREKHGSVPFISTACPSVVELVKKYYPDNVPDLAPVPSPLQTHSAYLRSLYGNEIAVVFIGPCVAKKLEADAHPGYPDYALTFQEVEEWMRGEKILPDRMDNRVPVEFLPAKAGRSSVYPVENGQIETSEKWKDHFIGTEALSVSGTRRIIASLEGIHMTEFLETLSCDGGCINGPGITKNNSVIERKKAINSFVSARLSEPDLFKGDLPFAEKVLEKGYGILGAEQPEAEGISIQNFSENEILGALRKLGKTSPEDELNCSGCGYETCRDMAKALLAGLSEVEMCVTKMRLDAESKLDILLSTIPHGVVIVDEELNMVEFNRRFLEIFDDYPEDFFEEDILQSLRGMSVSSFMPFASEFSEQFRRHASGQFRFRHRGRVMRLTFFFVESRMLLGAMFEDITTPVVRREAIIKKAENVINKSLSTVQQIASLLGENAAENEIVLNSIIEEFNVPEDTSGDYGLVEDSI